MQQFALAVALLGAVFTQLQGCGGDAATTAAPVVTDATATPTTASPTVAPTVFESGFKLDGMTKTQAESVKPAIEKGIADGFSLPADAVTITSITEASRRLDGRALGSHESTSLDIVFQATVPADKVAAMTATAITVASDSTALLAAVKAAVEASDASPEVKAAMAAATVSGFVIPTAVTTPDAGNTTRRLSFSFVTSDEPIVL